MNDDCKIKCETCKEMKHDTAFRITFRRWYELWKEPFARETGKCLDCEYPHRWDKIRASMKDIIDNNEK